MSLDNKGLLPHLLAATSSTLRHLHFAPFTDTRLSLLSPEAVAALVSVAPALQTLRMVTQSYEESLFNHCSNLEPVLEALQDVRELYLGINGFKLSSILPNLLRLKNLRILSISRTVQLRTGLTWGSVDDITPIMAINFLARSPSLQTLRLPSTLPEIWPKDDVKSVRQAASDNGVTLLFN